MILMKEFKIFFGYELFSGFEKLLKIRISISMFSSESSPAICDTIVEDVEETEYMCLNFFSRKTIFCHLNFEE